jgi:Ca-activated chloride channel family protein
MKALAQETGARAFFPMQLDELEGVYASIAEELATQYAIGYVSRNPVRNGAFRRLVVRLTTLPGTKPRTRTGYFADASRR